jgi:hypothetical protein
VIFTSPTGLLRDPSNTQADLRQALDRAGYPWVSSHVFRKTVASRLDGEGYGIRHIADQLGHSRPSTTMDFYSAGARSPPSTSLTPSSHSPVGASRWFVSGSHPTRRTRIPLYGGPRGSNPEPTD